MTRRPLDDHNRSETEEWTTYTASLITEVFSRGSEQIKTGQPAQLRIFDLCTGTGCIALLLHSLLHMSFPNLEVLGLDLSPKALNLARSNVRYNVQKGYLHPSAENQVQFLLADVLDKSLQLPRVDVLVSNPPYISPTDFNNGQTSRSVRTYEPRIALVPPSMPVLPHLKGDSEGDVFYSRILDLGLELGARLLVMEVGSLAQAKRVASMAAGGGDWARIEIWRDWIDGAWRNVGEVVELEGRKMAIRGEGNGRVVACWRALEPSRSS